MKSRKAAESDSDQTKKLLVGVGLIGVGLLTAAAIGLVLVKKREVAEEPDYDALLGIGA